MKLPMKPRQIRLTAATVLLLAGAALAAEGLWIPVKAQLAQVLLEQAWQEAREGKTAPRAWPWADTYPVARLQVPRLGVERIVLAGTSGEALAFGPGRLGTSPSTALQSTAFAGHRDTHFAFLRDLRPGDEVVVEEIEGEKRYRVEEMRIVDRRDLSILEGDAQRLVLITCYPFDAITAGDERYVVSAEILLDEPRSTNSAKLEQERGAL